MYRSYKVLDYSLLLINHTTMAKSNKVIVYSQGLVACSACVADGVTIEEIESEVNSQVPTGIKSQWKISKDTHFSDGINTNPCECQDDKTRKHYLLTC